MIIWLTGLSGAGKSTIANALANRLKYEKIEILDGDEVRENLSKGLGFSKEDRDTNIRRIGYVAELLSRNGVIVIVAAISPYKKIRAEIKSKSSQQFIEVFCDCPLAVLYDRDPKGLYKKVESGEIKNFTGVSDPYEIPENPDIYLNTNEEDIEESINKILSYLNDNIKTV